MTSSLRLFFACLLAVGSACGTNNASTTPAAALAGDGNELISDGAVGTATASGTIGGQGLSPQSATFLSLNTNTAQILAIALSSEPSYCSDLGQHQQRGGQHLAILSALSLDANGRPVSPQEGNYSISFSDALVLPSKRASALFSVQDGNCNYATPTPQMTARSGTLSLESISATSVKGSYSFQTAGGSMQGTFDAVPCPGLAAAGQGNTTLKCVDPNAS